MISITIDKNRLQRRHGPSPGSPRAPVPFWFLRCLELRIGVRTIPAKEEAGALFTVGTTVFETAVVLTSTRAGAHRRCLGRGVEGPGPRTFYWFMPRLGKPIVRPTAELTFPETTPLRHRQTCAEESVS